MRTQDIPHVIENRKDIPIMPPDLALRLTHISSNYHCLEHIFMVPKVFEPLKFYCIATPKTRPVLVEDSSSVSTLPTT